METCELPSIIGTTAATGIALGTAVIGSNAGVRKELRSEMQALHERSRSGVQTLGNELRSGMRDPHVELRSDVSELRRDVRALESRLSAVEQRQARTEGLLEGLRDAFLSHRAQELPVPNEAT